MPRGQPYSCRFLTILWYDTTLSIALNTLTILSFRKVRHSFWWHFDSLVTVLGDTWKQRGVTQMMTNLSWSVWRFFVSRWTGITAFSSLSRRVPNDSKILKHRFIGQYFRFLTVRDLLIACVVAFDCAIEFFICFRVFSSRSREASNWIRFSRADIILGIFCNFSKISPIKRAQ